MKMFENKESERDFIQMAVLFIAAGEAKKEVFDVKRIVHNAVQLRNELKQKSIENKLEL